MSKDPKAGADRCGKLEWQEIARETAQHFPYFSGRINEIQNAFEAILAAIIRSHQPPPSDAGAERWTDESLARFFHDTYEMLAPSFGYETRQETREFNPESKNGRLMVTVCGGVLKRFNASLDAERERSLADQPLFRKTTEANIKLLDQLQAKERDLAAYREALEQLKCYCGVDGNMLIADALAQEGK